LYFIISFLSRLSFGGWDIYFFLRLFYLFFSLCLKAQDFDKLFEFTF